jgi:hypothetical protein
MAFNAPINSIAPLSTPTDWVRPSDWPIITDTEDEVQFLVADTGAKSFSLLIEFTLSSGNLFIDWGDGTVVTVTSSGSQTSHIYSTGGTPCSRGYNTFKIRVYGDGDYLIQNVVHRQNIAVTGNNIFYNIGLLEAYYGDNCCTTPSFTQLFYSNAPSPTNFPSSYQLLEYVKLPATISWSQGMDNMFRNCTNLYKVVMPTSGTSLLTFSNTFNGCTNLLDFEFPQDALSIISLTSTFLNCINLRTVSFPSNLNQVQGMSSTFQGCNSLKNITFPSMDSNTNFGNMLNSCYSLQWVKFTSFPNLSFGSSILMSNAFQNCTQLQNVYFPETVQSNNYYTMSSTFSGCSALKNIVFPIGFNPASLANCFLNCSYLTSVVFQSNCPNLSSIASTFSGCIKLQNITLPEVVANPISLSSTFTSCQTLTSITVPSGWNVSGLDNTFTGCLNLETVILPNNTNNTITTLSGTFNTCVKLKSVTLPTILTGATQLSGTFQNCYSLTSVTFPTTMNSVTTAASCFLNCYDLQTAVLPTSLTSCLTFQGMFQNCYNIKEITLPGSVSSNATNYSVLVQNCNSLQTLTLPSTRTSLMNNITGMFQSCGNLTTINNLDKVGSLTATPLVSANMTSTTSTFGTTVLQSLSFSCPFSTLTLNGVAANSSNMFNRLNSLRLLNTGAGQWTGGSPQINVSYSDLSASALNQLFTDLTTISAKTINITGCTGAATCTRSIATAKGWTVTG